MSPARVQGCAEEVAGEVVGGAFIVTLEKAAMLDWICAIVCSEYCSGKYELLSEGQKSEESVKMWLYVEV